MQKNPTPPRRLRQPESGFVLLEALVALMIFAFGVLGMIGLQAAMTKSQTASKFRADASYLAQQLIGAMWIDITNLSSYQTSSCAGYARCAEWAGKISAALPSSDYTVTVDAATGEVTIRITWSAPNEGQHNYTTSTQIKS
ncbi:pilus assembly protein PilV [Variovorax paradoxus]|nr:pilus assembly protein PilV [Variovorax paradoxus]